MKDGAATYGDSRAPQAPAPAAYSTNTAPLTSDDDLPFD